MKYQSFAMCKVVRDKKTEKSRGYGFVSLLDIEDYKKAMKEMQGKYVGNRPIKLMPSKWTDKSESTIDAPNNKNTGKIDFSVKPGE